MPDQYGIKDLPDTSKIEDSKVYLVEGRWLNVIFSTLKQLWRGENVNKGPNIYLRQVGDAGYSISSSASGSGSGGGNAWTFKLYNTSKGSTGQLQVNGSDALVAALNGVIAKVSGTPNNVASGTPPVYPQLSITGNGYVYAYLTLSTTSGITTVTEIDIYYEGSVQTPLTDASTYAWILLGTITDYALTAGKVNFTLANAQSSGYSQFAMCNGSYMVW